MLLIVISSCSNNFILTALGNSIDRNEQTDWRKIQNFFVRNKKLNFNSFIRKNIVTIVFVITASFDYNIFTIVLIYNLLVFYG